MLCHSCVCWVSMPTDTSSLRPYLDPDSPIYHYQSHSSLSRATLFFCQSFSLGPSFCPPVPAAQLSSLMHHIQNSCGRHHYIPPPVLAHSLPLNPHPNQLLHSPPTPLCTPRDGPSWPVKWKISSFTALSQAVLAGVSLVNWAVSFRGVRCASKSETSARTIWWKNKCACFAHLSVALVHRKTKTSLFNSHVGVFLIIRESAV